MAAGVPVVATSVGSNPELLAEDRGMLVPPRDEDSLAAALGKLLENDGMRARMGQNCRNFAQENLTLEKMRSYHEQLYMELLARKGWRGHLAQPSSG